MGWVIIGVVWLAVCAVFLLWWSAIKRENEWAGAREGDNESWVKYWELRTKRERQRSAEGDR